MEMIFRGCNVRDVLNAAELRHFRFGLVLISWTFSPNGIIFHFLRTVLSLFAEVLGMWTSVGHPAALMNVLLCSMACFASQYLDSLSGCDCRLGARRSVRHVLVFCVSHVIVSVTEND